MGQMKDRRIDNNTGRYVKLNHWKRKKKANRERHNKELTNERKKRKGRKKRGKMTLMSTCGLHVDTREETPNPTTKAAHEESLHVLFLLHSQTALSLSFGRIQQSRCQLDILRTKVAKTCKMHMLGSNTPFGLYQPTANTTHLQCALLIVKPGLL